MNENLPTFLMCEVRKESHVPLDNYISLNMVENFVMKLELVASSQRSGWDETNFLERDRDREIRLMKIHHETETEKKWLLIF